MVASPQEQGCPDPQSDYSTEPPSADFLHTQLDDQPNHSAVDGTERDGGQDDHPVLVAKPKKVGARGYDNISFDEAQDRTQRGSPERAYETSAEPCPGHLHRVLLLGLRIDEKLVFVTRLASFQAFEARVEAGPKIGVLARFNRLFPFGGAPFELPPVGAFI